MAKNSIQQKPKWFFSLGDINHTAKRLRKVSEKLLKKWYLKPLIVYWIYKALVRLILFHGVTVRRPTFDKITFRNKVNRA